MSVKEQSDRVREKRMRDTERETGRTSLGNIGILQNLKTLKYNLKKYSITLLYL